MNVDMTKAKVGDRVRLRSGEIATIIYLGETSLSQCPYGHNGGSDNLAIRVYADGKCCANWPEMDIVEILTPHADATPGAMESGKREDDICVWSYDRTENDIFPNGAVWTTECGYEFDRMRCGEQPRKRLAMEFCPYCGKHISDDTQDC